MIENGCIVDCNPANGAEIARVKCSTPAEVDAMIAKAREAQLEWFSHFTIAQRVGMLKEGCSALGRDKECLAKTMTLEMGKVLGESRDEADGAADKDDFLDLIAAANQPQQLEDAVIVRDPMGVVVVLAPWNFPADEILLLALPALVAGNAVIVKPSEVAPLTGALVVEALASAVPPGVVQLAQGDGAVGARLVSSPDVDMVAMTGSSAVGRKLVAACAKDLKRLVLELGGKDPMVVFADADLDKAAHDAVFFSLFNCGQVCCSVERIYVDEAVKEEFEAKVVELAKSYTLDDGLQEGAKVGPMVSAMQRDIVAAQVSASVSAGASLLFQGPSLPSSGGGGGNFFPVTVLSDLTQDMDIQSCETFGPVVALASFDGSEAEAIRLANDTEVGR